MNNGRAHKKKSYNFLRRRAGGTRDLLYNFFRRSTDFSERRAGLRVCSFQFCIHQRPQAVDTRRHTHRHRKNTDRSNLYGEHFSTASASVFPSGSGRRRKKSDAEKYQTPAAKRPERPEKKIDSSLRCPPPRDSSTPKRHFNEIERRFASLVQ